MDDEAARRLSSMELYRITTAALEGHQMRRLAYCALIDNYNSLIGTSNHKDNACINLSTSSIFAQCNISDSPEVNGNTKMVNDIMRRAIHKLLPEDLEKELTGENGPYITGHQGPTEDPFGGHSDAIHISFTNDAFQNLCAIIQKNFTVAGFKYLINQISTFCLTDK